MKKQNQIYAEKDDEEIQQEEKVDMREVLKDMQGLHQRVKYATHEVQEQDKKLVRVNEKLDDYNKEVSHGENLNDIVNKGVFSSIWDGIKGIFKSKPKYELKDKDQKILNKAKNKETKIEEEDNTHNLGFKEDGEWAIIKKDKYKDNDKYDEDEVIDDTVKELKGMIKSAKKFNQNVKESTEVAEVTNKHFDKSSHHVNKAIKKMKDGI